MPLQEHCDTRQQNEERAEPCHHMKRVVQQLDVVGPCCLGELIQAGHFRVECAVREKTQKPGDHDRVVEPFFPDIGLTDDHDPNGVSSLEMSFHRGKADGLIPGDEFRLTIPGRKRDEEARDEAGDDADSQEPSALIAMDVAQNVVRAYC